MESLRRLRLVWALLWLAVAAVCAVALFGNISRPGVNPLYLFFWLGSALCCAFAFYAQSLFGKLSVLWLGGVGGFMLGTVLTREPTPAMMFMTIGGIGGVWLVALVLVWIIKPSVK